MLISLLISACCLPVKNITMYSIDVYNYLSKQIFIIKRSKYDLACSFEKLCFRSKRCYVIYIATLKVNEF